MEGWWKDGKVLFFLARNLPILSSSTRKTTGLDKEGRHGRVEVYPVSKFLFWWLEKPESVPPLHPSHWFFLLSSNQM